MGYIRPDDFSVGMTFFSKDRDDFATSNELLLAYIDTTGSLKLDISDSDDITVLGTATLGGLEALSAQSWTFIGYSVQIDTANTGNCDVRIWTDNNDEVSQTTTLTGFFWVDNLTGYPAYLGSYRTDTSAYSGYFKGFMYNFYIYNNATPTGSPNGPATCHADCSGHCTSVDTECLANWEFTQYGVGLDCRTSCTDGCVRDEECNQVDCETGFSHCNLCFDRECTQCSDYNESDCLATMCAGSSGKASGTGDCACTATNGRSSTDRLCTPCHTNCDACTSDDAVDYELCSACTSSSSKSDPTIFYCLTVCPTGYTGTAPNDCVEATDAATNMIVSYNFNAPMDTFANTGSSSGSFDITLTEDIPCGHPAKDRGIYYNGVCNGFAQLNSAFILAHTTSIHSWVNLNDVSGTMTLFAKDRNVFPNNRLLQLYIDAGVPKIDLSNDIDANNIETGTAGTTLVVDTWYYLTFAMQMQQGKNTDFTIYNANTADGTGTLTGNFIVDAASNIALIAVNRDQSGATDYINRWNGYILNFNIYQTYHDISNTSFATCFSCLVAEFNEYSDGVTVQTCATPTCDNISCVKSGTCQDVTNECDDGFCHLCHDRECKLCNTYTACVDGHCTQSTGAQSNGGNCECQTGFGRADINSLCDSCHGTCNACDVGGTNNYSDCTLCDSSSFGITHDVTPHYYCLNYCPTTFTAGTQPDCTPGGSYLVYESNFSLFSDTWENNGISFLTTDQDVYPAKYRGQYFNGSTSYMKFSNFTLSTSFTIMAWIRVDSIQPSCLFSKDNGTFPNADIFQAYWDALGFLNVEISNRADPGNGLTTNTSSVDAQLAPVDWKLVVFAVAMASNTEDSDIQLWINESTNAVSETITGRVYEDDVSSYPAFLGIQRSTAETDKNTPFPGFIYSVKIYNTVLADITQYPQPATCSGSCAGLTCTDVATECLGDWGFTEWGPSQTCGSGCGGIGCVRDGDCNISKCDGTFAFCHLCYDRECTICSNYFSADCDAIKCADTTNATEASGVCTCDGTYGRIDHNYQCLACHSFCETCDNTPVPDFNACTSCSSGNHDISPAATSYSYCVNYCPSGYETSSGCTPPVGSTADVSIIELQFNAPTSTFVSAGIVATDFDVTPNVDNESGHPAKNRGIRFDGTSDGYAQISGLFLNHSFSVHGWTYMSVNDADMSFFSKDRNDDAGMNLVQCKTNVSGQMQAKLAVDTSPFAFGTANGATTLTVGTWYYMVWSFEMIEGRHTVIDLYLNNAQDAQTQVDNKFLMDGTGFNAYIGASRSATTTYADRWNGFVYDFHLYQLKHEISYTTLFAGGCTSGCYTFNFDLYNPDSPTACDSPSCDNRSCVRDGACQPETECDGAYDYCHLCYDRECTGCTNYTGCEADKCAASAAAVSNNGDQCECNEGYGRPTGADSVNHVCQACCPGCATCDQGGQTNFGDCLSCLATHYALQINATSYFMCLEYCPTQWGGSHPTCTAPSDLEIIHQNLADFASPWGIVESADAGSSTYPGKERGQHFNGTDQYLLFNPNFKLAPSFTMEIWIWCTDLSVERSILGKDRGVTADNTVFRAGIEVTTGLLFAELANKDFTSLVKTTATSGTNITNTAWAKVGFSIALQDNAVDSDVRLWISDTAGVDAGVTQTASGAYYSDSASGYAG